MNMSAPPPITTLRNRPYNEIAIGDSASLQRTLSQQDIQLFAVLSGDVNPQHLDPEFAATTDFQGVIAHGMWGANLISGLLGTRLPGPGTIYRSQVLRFLAPVRVGDTLTITVTVSACDSHQQLVTLSCLGVNQQGVAVVEGEAVVSAPTQVIECSQATLPEVRLYAGGGIERLLDRVRPLGSIRVAVVHPCDSLSLSGTLDAYAAGLIEPILVGPKSKIEAMLPPPAPSSSRASKKLKPS